MDYTPFIFRLIILFTPGVIVSIILEFLTISKEKNSFRFIVSSIVNGMLTFFLYYPVSKILKLPYSFFESINKDVFSINVTELIYVNLVGVIYALLLTIIYNYKLFNKLFYIFRITNKTGENGVWSHILSLNPYKNDTQWINVIDKDDKIMYLGFLQFYSDNLDKDNEMFLRNVDVYSYDNNKIGDLIYQTPATYLCKSREKYIIEFPHMKYVSTVDKNKSLRNQIAQVFKKEYSIIKRIVSCLYKRVLKSYYILFRRKECQIRKND